jgi:acyl transferase domain-containing protein
VIRASSINNDGSAKVGFTAPSGQGQSDVIAQTLALADVSPRSIDYVEAHGTATPLGDPIEIEALTQAFKGDGNENDKGYCAIGSVKTNVGHLETASGITGLIKVVQMLRHRELVPSINFSQQNDQIAFADTPFYISNETRHWPKPVEHPRRAAISSFGMGGTNVHAILEEAPQTEGATCAESPYAVLTLSARSQEGLDQATEDLRLWLKQHPDADIPRVAASLQLGRKAFEYRRALVCRDATQASSMLGPEGIGHLLTRHSGAAQETAFLFAGGGTQHPGMTGDLYRDFPHFAQQVDLCAQQLDPMLGFDIRQFILAPADDRALANRMQDPEVMFPALFTVQYAMAQQFLRFGIRPSALLGHSAGEYVAATLAGVMDLSTALEIVALRALLMMQMPRGAMLLLPVPLVEAEALIADRALSIGAENGPKNTVISGTIEAVESLWAWLEAETEIEPKEVHVNGGLHSHLTASIRDEFERALSRITFNAPRIPLVSSVTGQWLTAQEATTPEYWGRHLQQTVRFRTALQTLMSDRARVLVDVGPNQVAGALARQNMGSTRWEVVNATRTWDEARSDLEQIADALARLWLLGTEIDWQAGYSRRPRPLPLPTYPFQRKRYWIEASAERGAMPFEALDLLSEQEETSEATPNLPGRPSLMVAYVAPADEREVQIADIWQRFLGFERIGTEDNFIELGGTSLLATEVTQAIKEHFSIDLSLNDFLKAGTIRALSRLIEDLKIKREKNMAEELLALVAGMADEEISRLLKEPTNTRSA